MTNKEAISNLKDIKTIIYEVFPMTEEDKELSLDLAIKALKQIDLIKFNIHALNKLIEETENENQG